MAHVAEPSPKPKRWTGGNVKNGDRAVTGDVKSFVVFGPQNPRLHLWMSSMPKESVTKPPLSFVTALVACEAAFFVAVFEVVTTKSEMG